MRVGPNARQNLLQPDDPDCRYYLAGHSFPYDRDCPRTPQGPMPRCRPPRTDAAATIVGLVVLMSSVGCSPAKVASNPPPHHTHASIVDLTAPAGGYMPVDRVTADGLTAVAVSRPIASVTHRPLNVLAVSGGGQFGSYAAGLLVGWSCRGDRPEFDVVTGISSGALIAALAFNGPKYDPLMQQLFTTLTTEELFCSRRPCRNIRLHSSLSTSGPLQDLIDRTINDEFLSDMQAAHACGRRLYVGTMILNTRRPVFWDLGAIACGPDGHVRVKKILLAAASIPGMLPAVPLCVEVDGQKYEELHVDGGGVAQTFVRFGEHHPRPDPAHPSAPWLAGSNLYLIGGGKMYAEVLEPELGLLARVTSTVSGTLFALFRADVWRLYTLCRVSGMSFSLAVMPDDVPSSPNSMEFDPDLQLRLYTLAFDKISCGTAWRCTPPGYEAGEEDYPRTGFCLSVPCPKPPPGPWVPERRRGGRSLVRY